VGLGWASVFSRGDQEFGLLEGGRGSPDGEVGEKWLSGTWKQNLGSLILLPADNVLQ